MMERLPDELLLVILNYCTSYTVHALTLTNRRLNGLAQPYLYRSHDSTLSFEQGVKLAVTLARRRSFGLLCQSFSFGGGPKEYVRICHNLRSARLLPATDQELIRSCPLYQSLLPPEDNPNGQFLVPSKAISKIDTPALLGSLWMFCPNLTTLSLTCNWLIGRSLPLLSPRLQRLQTLRIRGHPFPEYKHEALLDPLSTFPSLRHLELSGCDPYFQEQQTPFCFSITSVTLSYCDIFPGDLVRLLGGLSNLESFDYTWYAGEYAYDLMTAHATTSLLFKQKSTLRSLRLIFTPLATVAAKANPVYFIQFSEATQLATFHQLETLEVEYPAFLDDEKMNWAEVHLPEQLTAPLEQILPPKLKWLKLRHCLGRVRLHLYRLLQACHPAIVDGYLKVIHIEMWPDYQNDSWDQLKELFTDHGIELVVEWRMPAPFQKAEDLLLDHCPYEDDYATEAEWQR